MRKLLNDVRASKRSHAIIAALTGVLSVLLAAGVSIVIDDPGPNPQPGQHTTTTITLGGPGHQQVTLTPPAQAVAKTQAAQDAAGQEQAAHSDLKAEPAAATAPDVLAHDQAIAPVGQQPAPASIPQAAVNVPGCRTLHVRNFSSRAGSPTLLFTEHQTISPDNGWNGVLGNVAWFDSLAAQASSNFIISRAGGQCAYIVPTSLKAWAQAGFNSVSWSVEVTETGREGSYLVGAGRARMIQLMRLFHRVTGVPYRHGKVSGCTVVRSGYVEHADLGVCGGGHHDDQPYSIDPLIAAAKAADAAAAVPAVTSLDKLRCARLNKWRAAGRPKRYAHPAVLRKRTLIAHRVVCDPGKPARR
jgi:hypothetical protein